MGKVVLIFRPLECVVVFFVWFSGNLRIVRDEVGRELELVPMFVGGTRKLKSIRMIS